MVPKIKLSEEVSLLRSCYEDLSDDHSKRFAEIRANSAYKLASALKRQRNLDEAHQMYKRALGYLQSQSIRAVFDGVDTSTGMSEVLGYRTRERRGAGILLPMAFSLERRDQV